MNILALRARMFIQISSSNVEKRRAYEKKRGEKKSGERTVGGERKKAGRKKKRGATPGPTLGLNSCVELAGGVNLST